MKKKINLIVFIIILISIFHLTFSQNTLKKPLYQKNGFDWVGKCNAGKFQSPINIIEDFNTIEDTSMVSFDYSLQEDGVHKKFLYSNDQIYMDINLGKMAFMNSGGANEIYEAYRIELHFPSEHYITINNQTPRYPLEMQIYHKLVVSDKPTITNNSIKVNRAIVSVLFTIGDVKQGDEFLNQLGISRYNMDSVKNFFKFNDTQYIDQKNFIVGTYDTGFNIKALQGLLNILNADHHTFMYYGSETHPPCKEDIFWVVFGRPRSISQGQFDFLKNQLAQEKKNRYPSKLKNKKEYFGNKRVLQPYNDNFRGKIRSNKQGVRQVLRQNFFKLKTY